MPICWVGIQTGVGFCFPSQAISFHPPPFTLSSSRKTETAEEQPKKGTDFPYHLFVSYLHPPTKTTNTQRKSEKSAKLINL